MLLLLLLLLYCSGWTKQRRYPQKISSIFDLWLIRHIIGDTFNCYINFKVVCVWNVAFLFKMIWCKGRKLHKKDAWVHSHLSNVPPAGLGAGREGADVQKHNTNKHWLHSHAFQDTAAHAGDADVLLVHHPLLTSCTHTQCRHSWRGDKTWNCTIVRKQLPEGKAWKKWDWHTCLASVNELTAWMTSRYV